MTKEMAYGLFIVVCLVVAVWTAVHKSEKCPHCSGTGRLIDYEADCPICNGRGFLP